MTSTQWKPVASIPEDGSEFWYVTIDTRRPRDQPAVRRGSLGHDLGGSTRRDRNTMAWMSIHEVARAALPHTLPASYAPEGAIVALRRVSDGLRGRFKRVSGRFVPAESRGAAVEREENWVIVAERRGIRRRIAGRPPRLKTLRSAAHL